MVEHTCNLSYSETEIWRTPVQGQPGQKRLHINKQARCGGALLLEVGAWGPRLALGKRAGGMTQVVEQLPSKAKP
jgi:hypothetical protein